MYKFTSLSADPKQQVTMVLDDQTRVTFNFEYKSNQLGWFFGITCGDINYQNIRLTTAYNCLRAYKSYLPFGLRCDTVDNEEPTDITDFISGYTTLYLLLKEDVEAIEGNYYAKV